MRYGDTGLGGQSENNHSQAGPLCTHEDKYKYEGLNKRNTISLQSLIFSIRKIILKRPTETLTLFSLHPQSYQCQSPESGLIQNHLGLNKTGLCRRLETTMTRQGLGAPSLSLLANPTILHTTLLNPTLPYSTLPFYI